MKRDLGSIDLKGNGGEVPRQKPHIGNTFERCLIWGAIILPAVAIIIENRFHCCAKLFFDPFPSNAHTFLCALIPVSGLLAWMSLKRNIHSSLGLMLFTNGMAVGVALLYTIMFFPLMPVSLASIPYFGAGLLGFSPIAALFVLWFSGHRAAKVASSAGTYFHAHQVNHAGHLVILAMVLAVELPSTLTRVALSMACKPETEQQGLNILRTAGSQEVMLRACYERSGRATDILGSLYEVAHPSNVEEMRKVFYRVTGRTFNSFPIPEAARATMTHTGAIKKSDGLDQGAEDEFDSDPDIAGEMVSGVSRGLSVNHSRINARVDSDAAVAQIDWYLDFNNKSRFDREVRTRIRLPHGGVISSAGLIVNSKEYKCTTEAKEQARQIYRASVQSKQNPLLVSSCAQDSVLVQCYPVPPGDKLSLHLTAVAPLALDKNKNAVLALPQFEERNFQINVPHDLQFSANHEINASWTNMKQDRSRADEFQLSGQLDPGKLATGSGIVSFKRGDSNVFWCRDEYGNLKNTPLKVWVTEKLTNALTVKPKNIAVVVDLSASMKDYIKEIATALKKLPEDIDTVTIVGAGDKLTVWRDKRANLEAGIARLNELPCAGGQIDGEALVSGLATCSPLDAVLWLHGAQPYAPDNWNSLLFSRYFVKPRLYDMQLCSGPNAFLDDLRKTTTVETVPRFANCGDDLSLLFESWKTPGLLKKFDRQESWWLVTNPAIVDPGHVNDLPTVTQNVSTIPEDPDFGMLKSTDYPALESYLLSGANKPTDPDIKESSSPLVLLWANERIKYLLRHRWYPTASALAKKYDLVTPVSSAVLADTIPEMYRLASGARVVEEADTPETAFARLCAPLFGSNTQQPEYGFESLGPFATPSSVGMGHVRRYGPGLGLAEKQLDIVERSVVDEVPTVIDRRQSSINRNQISARPQEMESAGKKKSAMAEPRRRYELNSGSFSDKLEAGSQVDAYSLPKGGDFGAMDKDRVSLQTNSIPTNVPVAAAAPAPVRAGAAGGGGGGWSSGPISVTPSAHCLMKSAPVAVPGTVLSRSSRAIDAPSNQSPYSAPACPPPQQLPIYIPGTSPNPSVLPPPPLPDPTIINGVNTAGTVSVDDVVTNENGDLDVFKVLRKYGFLVLAWSLAVFCIVHKVVNGQLEKFESEKASNKNSPQDSALKIIS